MGQVIALRPLVPKRLVSIDFNNPNFLKIPHLPKRRRSMEKLISTINFNPFVISRILALSPLTSDFCFCFFLSPWHLELLYPLVSLTGCAFFIALSSAPDSLLAISILLTFFVCTTFAITFTAFLKASPPFQSFLSTLQKHLFSFRSTHTSAVKLTMMEQKIDKLRERNEEQVTRATRKMNKQRKGDPVSFQRRSGLRPRNRHGHVQGVRVAKEVRRRRREYLD